MHSLNQEDMERKWSQISDLYIKPELVERSKVSPIDLSDVRKVLIKLPKNCDPIVEINEEAQFLYAVEDPIARTAGETLESHEIMAIKEILPPKVDDHSVAFIYAWRARNHVYFAIDFSPNGPDFDEENHGLGAGLHYRLECELLELVLAPAIHSIDKLQDIGVSVFPALVPYPINTIVKQLLNCEKSQAISVIEDYCNPDFIRKLMVNWYSIKPFGDRKGLFDETLQAHSCGYYHVTISTLIGQIEGIITDWLIANKEANTPWKAESKFKEFQRLIESVVPIETVEEIILQSVSRFLVSPDTILRSFSKWNNPALNVDSPSRHPMTHGKYVPEYYTKANSIKMFLVIDSISWCIQCYENYKKDIHTESQ